MSYNLETQTISRKQFLSEGLNKSLQFVGLGITVFELAKVKREVDTLDENSRKSNEQLTHEFGSLDAYDVNTSKLHKDIECSLRWISDPSGINEFDYQCNQIY